MNYKTKKYMKKNNKKEKKIKNDTTFKSPPIETITKSASNFNVKIFSIDFKYKRSNFDVNKYNNFLASVDSDNELEIEILINLVYAPVLTLGPGIRIGIWFQGCSIRCKGCISKHTWEFDKKYTIKISDLIKQVKQYSKTYNTNSITISGGEPFDQPLALLILLKELKKLKFNDILLYTGYKMSYLKKRYKNILDYIDVIIDGPFIETKKTNKIYKGSSNQKMYILNTNLKEIYKKYSKKLKTNKLQMINKNNEIYLIGIPNVDFQEKIKNKINLIY